MRGSQDDVRLNDIQFGNNSSVAFTGENDIFIDDGKFNPTNMKYADGVLAIPLRHGWRSQDYFLFGRHFKSKVLQHEGFPLCSFALGLSGFDSSFATNSVTHVLDRQGSLGREEGCSHQTTI